MVNIPYISVRVFRCYKACSISGNEMVRRAYGRREQTPERMTKSVAEQLGCDLDNNAAMIECLRGVNASTLVDTAPDILV